MVSRREREMGVQFSTTTYSLQITVQTQHISTYHRQLHLCDVVCNVRLLWLLLNFWCWTVNVKRVSQYWHVFTCLYFVMLMRSSAESVELTISRHHHHYQQQQQQQHHQEEDLTCSQVLYTLYGICRRSLLSLLTDCPPRIAVSEKITFQHTTSHFFSLSLLF